MTPIERGAAMPRSGLRPTRQRLAIAAALAGCEEFRSAQEIHESLRAAGETIGLSTVYRTLQAMTEAGEVDMLRAENGEAIYRRCSTDHHHHLVCRDCGTTVEIDDPPIERWAAATAAAHGFTSVTHTLEVFGRCPSCSSGS